MGLLSRLRTRKFDIKLGYSNYLLLSESEADAMNLGIRLENNLPRYIKQTKILLDRSEIEVAAKGITIRYSKKGKVITAAISRDHGFSFDEFCEKALPRGKKKSNEATILLMAQTEVELWP